jgi:hypothetical protein
VAVDHKSGSGRVAVAVAVAEWQWIEVLGHGISNETRMGCIGAVLAEMWQKE